MIQRPKPQTEEVSTSDLEASTFAFPPCPLSPPPPPSFFRIFAHKPIFDRCLTHGPRLCHGTSPPGPQSPFASAPRGYGPAATKNSKISVDTAASGGTIPNIYQTSSLFPEFRHEGVHCCFLAEASWRSVPVNTRQRFHSVRIQAVHLPRPLFPPSLDPSVPSSLLHRSHPWTMLHVDV
jgi:hypothetical protein